MQDSKIQDHLKVFHLSTIQPAGGRKYLTYKRLLDIVLATIGLMALSLLFIIIAVLIKLEDPRGSVLFKQIRIGKDGTKFHMYKFRSMVSNAEELLEELLDQNEASGALFKMKQDPRITRIGKFIRKTSIDELPQLWNVLKGEMSLVGPRPPLEREVADYSERDLMRLIVTPGCTGLWQLNGRSNLGFEEMVTLDLQYIQSRSLMVDLKIICKTLLVFFRSDHAY